MDPTIIASTSNKTNEKMDPTTTASTDSTDSAVENPEMVDDEEDEDDEECEIEAPVFLEPVVFGKDYSGPIDFEIVGLHQPCGDNHFCWVHGEAPCGPHLRPGILLELVLTMVPTKDDDYTLGYKVVMIHGDTHGCTVGYVPIKQTTMITKHPHRRKFAVVNEIYKESDDTTKKNKAKRNRGMASCMFVIITNPSCILTYEPY
jgi:hypothetical protein